MKKHLFVMAAKRAIIGNAIFAAQNVMKILVNAQIQIVILWTYKKVTA
jgi:hypothetical protein